MERNQALELVEELLQTAHDYEVLDHITYYDRLIELKERIIDALTTGN